MALRWEWRSFSDSFGTLDRRLRRLATSMCTSDERYVMSRHSRENVKIRSGMLAIKTLDDVNADGLERWQPVMLAPFPLSPGEVQEAHLRLVAPCPPLLHRRYTAEQWLTEVVSRVPSLTTVHVIKTRHGSTFNDCSVGLSDLLVDGVPLTTIVVAMEDPARVLRTVRLLGLDAYGNEDYITALGRIAVRAPLVACALA